MPNQLQHRQSLIDFLLRPEHASMSSIIKKGTTVPERDHIIGNNSGI